MRCPVEFRYGVCIHYFSSSQPDGLSPLAFNFKPEYAIKEVQKNQEGLDTNGLNELLVYDVNFLGKNMNTTKNNTKIFIQTIK
jgi:hypothetical protein